MDSRERKGITLAATKTIAFQDGRWLIPSQTTQNKIYRVRFGPDEYSCTCADFEVDETYWCKHLYAVRSHLEGRGNLPAPKPRSPARKKYPRQWPEYNEGKANEPSKFKRLLFELCRGLPTPKPGKKGGRPRLPLADLVYAAVTKVYVGSASRQLTSHKREAHEAGFISQIPRASSVLNFFSSPDTAELLKDLIGLAAAPLNDVEDGVFATDSTTFSLPLFKKWFDKEKGGVQVKRLTVKCHLFCGVKTNVIAAATFTKGHELDGREFPTLLHNASKRFRIVEVSADKAYNSVDNFKAVQEVGATPFIPFRHNASGYSGGYFEEMYHFYRLRNKEFRERYLLRNNAESTASMLKRRFEGVLDSRTDPAIENEVLCRVLVHNLCRVIQSHFELGIEADFWDTSAVKYPPET